MSEICGCGALLGASREATRIRAKRPPPWLCRSCSARMVAKSRKGTPEQRASARAAAKAKWARMTPEQRSECARSTNENMTPEQRSKRSRLAYEATPLETLAVREAAMRAGNKAIPWEARSAQSKARAEAYEARWPGRRSEMAKAAWDAMSLDQQRRVLLAIQYNEKRAAKGLPRVRSDRAHG